MNSHKMYITDAEFDELHWYEEQHYFWCEECNMFYSRELIGKACDHGSHDGSTNDGK